MKKFFLFVIVLGVSTLAFSRGKKTSGVGMEYLDSSFKFYDTVQKQIHSFAEVGYQEFRSSALLKDVLGKNGFSVTSGSAGIPTAFVASYGSGKPVIGILAEYDALPSMAQDTVPYRSVPEKGGAGHGCGHNLIGTAAVAGAVAISKYLAAGHRVGTVCVFGCPAEEGGGGKAYMTREGVFDDVDVMLDWHPDTQICVNDKTGLANIQVKFSFHGTSAHASGAPENGRSALDAVEAFDYMMNMMREHIPSSSRIHYVILNGGKSPNVVPDFASVQYYFRSPNRTTVDDIFARALKAAEGAAMGTGTTMDYEIVSGNYERLQNSTLNKVIDKNLRLVGGIRYEENETRFAREMMDASGVKDQEAAMYKIQNVIDASENNLSEWVSSDVGNVTWVVPTGSFRMASFVPAGSGHCWQQVASGGTTIGTKGLIAAAKVFYLTAVDLLSDPNLVNSVKKEFLDRRPADFKFIPLMGDRLPPCPHAQNTYNTNIHDLSLNKEFAQNVDTVCTYRVSTKGISDQGNSGRCWLFSVYNVLRAEAMKENLDLGEFYFSFTFGQYWDLYEKCRHWLDEARMYSREPSRSRMDDQLYKKPIGDGGHFLNAAHLIDKYGVVPLEVMPEVYSSQNNVPLMNTLRTLLRKYGLKYRMSPEKDHGRITEAAMNDVRTVLDNMLGAPPSEFEWRGKVWTPISFRDRYVNHDMERDYAFFADDPSLPYYEMYEVDESRNCLEYPNWHFLNLPAEEIDSLGVASLKAGKMYVISADVSHECDAMMGIYDGGLHDYTKVLGVDLSMDKKELALSCESRSEHAIAVCGVLLDNDGKAKKWLIENSFGTVRGWGGFVVMGADWLDKYQWRCIVEKQFVPQKYLKMFDKKPKLLPSWYPLY